MAHEIPPREVINNLISFKESLLSTQGKARARLRSYPVLVNIKTGAMQFPQKIKNLESRIAKRVGKKDSPNLWKEMKISVFETYFEMRNGLGQKLEPTEVDPLAWRIIRETIEVLNEKAKELKERVGDELIEQAVLQNLSSLQIGAAMDRIEDLPTWAGTLGREEAEKELEGRPFGSYLLREGDPLTRAMGFHFTEQNHMMVQPFLLTLVEEDEKISDVLLIRTPKGWTVYRDDPNLNDPFLYNYEPTPEALLRLLRFIR